MVLLKFTPVFFRLLKSRFWFLYPSNFSVLNDCIVYFFKSCRDLSGLFFRIFPSPFKEDQFNDYPWNENWFLSSFFPFCLPNPVKKQLIMLFLVFIGCYNPQFLDSIILSTYLGAFFYFFADFENIRRRDSSSKVCFLDLFVSLPKERFDVFLSFVARD